MGEIFDYLLNDHNRLDELLSRAAQGPNRIDLNPYKEFRKGLLRHIGVEEKIVLPALVRYQNGKQAEIARRIRLDHGALVALLVPSPTPAIIETVKMILNSHNSIEEAEGGLYRLIERFASRESGIMLERMKAYPEVPVLPFNDKPGIIDATRRAVERAGYKARF